MLKKLAKLIRGISIPPIVVSILVLILILTNTITNKIDGLLIFIFLGFIPLLAYPLALIIKPIRAKKREGQRNMAFFLSMIGYTAGLIYSLVANIEHSLQVLYLTYFISVIVLIFINKILKIRASGHLTSITGPLVALVYFIGWQALIPCLFFYALVFWSSLYLKRHTKQEMILGTLIVISSFGLTHLLLLIF